MAEKNSRKGKKIKVEEAGFKVVEIDPEKLRKAMEEAGKKGLALFPGRPGRGPCGGCDVVMSPRYPRYR